MNTKNILLADDNPDNLQTIFEILTKAYPSYKILKANNGKIACKLAESRLPDLIITDWEMPEMDGIETIKYLKQQPSTADIPIIMASGIMTSSQNLETALNAGAVDYIRKPIDKIELIARVNSMLKLSDSYKFIKEQNKQLKQQQEEIRTQNEDLIQKNEEIIVQKEQIEEQTKDITDSILYAGRIQEAILPTIDVLKNQFPKSFVFYKPSQIVSGDFYWFKEVKNMIYIAVADCTGHGVPGAFMSILGISLLNEIITRRYINSPDIILNELRKRIKKSLHQTGQQYEQQDGMDIAICLIDTENYILEYAGAYNSLYLIHNHSLTEYKADRMPIGIHPKDHIDFSKKNIQLQPKDTIYLFTDGYSSQFGFLNDEKFKVKNFQKLINQISELPMEQQYDVLSKTFYQWKGNKQQTDDILVVGLQIE